MRRRLSDVAEPNAQAARQPAGRHLAGIQRYIDKVRRRILTRSAGRREPAIICPYVDPAHRTQVRQAFGLDEPRGRHLPFHFWHDRKLEGPEAAFQACWKSLPGNDIIIIHTDMAPMPDDVDNDWYRRLLAHVDELPDAGAVACDLLFPLKTSNGNWAAQSVGGLFTTDGEITHLGGHDHDYDERYADVRRAAWVTFGGVYVRRKALDMCGDFDTAYRWAYVMDVDYCLKMRLRGWNLYQVPVNLLHRQNGSTQPYLDLPEYQELVRANYATFREKWSDVLASGKLAL